MEDNKGLSYFFLGLGIGVAVGMIFAPQAGAETRTLIKNRAQEGGDYLKRRSDELKAGAEDLVGRGKQIVNRQRDRLTASLDAGKQAYRETMSGEQPASDITTPAEGI